VKMFSFQLCRSLVSVMICLLMIAGCAPPPRGGTPLEAITQTLDEPAATAIKAEVPPPPPEIRSALIPSSQLLAATPDLQKEAHFDIAASQVPARTLILPQVRFPHVIFL